MRMPRASLLVLLGMLACAGTCRAVDEASRSAGGRSPPVRAAGTGGWYRASVPGRRLYVTDAIVLSRFDFGEADRILTLLTPELGKIKAIAKGIRRPASRIPRYWWP